MTLSAHRLGARPCRQRVRRSQVIGTASALGTLVPMGGLADHVFGVCLVNDWSAGDLQSEEHVLMGRALSAGMVGVVTFSLVGSVAESGTGRRSTTPIDGRP